MNRDRLDVGWSIIAFALDTALRVSSYGLIDYHPLKAALIEGVIRLDAESPLAIRPAKL
jgi:hypothetical protein